MSADASWNDFGVSLKAETIVVRPFRLGSDETDFLPTKVRLAQLFGEASKPRRQKQKMNISQRPTCDAKAPDIELDAKGFTSLG